MKGGQLARGGHRRLFGPIPCEKNERACYSVTFPNQLHQPAMTSDYEQHIASITNGISDGLEKLWKLETKEHGKARDARNSYESVRNLSIADIDELTSPSHKLTHRAQIDLYELNGILVSFKRSSAYFLRCQDMKQELAKVIPVMISTIPADSQWAPVAALEEFVVWLKA